MMRLQSELSSSTCRGMGSESRATCWALHDGSAAQRVLELRGCIRYVLTAASDASERLLTPWHTSPTGTRRRGPIGRVQAV